ncbi:MAG TPA: hypothetical protein VNV42_16625 [Solirubrobacteraceae bacterium]|jgi:hypothetical protein|nr:hypothetical protein [Solirubrobacteraceae bacterium]
MSASPEALHLLAHRATSRPRDDNDWWGSPVETALAAVSATRHPPAHREQAERALDALERWWRAGAPRAVSADAVALALAARAAAALARRDASLTAAAVAAVVHMADRAPEVVPELHVAMACWALDDVVPDRDQAPWPALRARLSVGNAYGLDQALRAYSQAIAARGFDAGQLVQRLVTQVPTSPGPTDAAVVLWLMEIAIDRCARALQDDEPGLRALIEWRANITGRLALELGDAAFSPPSSDDFDPEDLGAGATPLHLSSMEALLLDIALAPTHPEAPWLTYPEAKELLGEEARQATLQAQRARRHTVWAVIAIALLAGAATGSALALAHARDRIAIGWGLTVALALLTAALGLARRVFGAAALLDALGVAAATAALAAAVGTANQMLARPLFSDAAGLIGGALLAVLATIIWTVITARSRRAP